MSATATATAPTATATGNTTIIIQQNEADKLLRQHTPCDSCGVRSEHVVLNGETAILTFCGHHTRKNADKLKTAYTILPDTYAFPETTVT